jgi:hypothetical protein
MSLHELVNTYIDEENNLIQVVLTLGNAIGWYETAPATFYAVTVRYLGNAQGTLVTMEDAVRILTDAATDLGLDGNARRSVLETALWALHANDRRYGIWAAMCGVEQLDPGLIPMATAWMERRQTGLRPDYHLQSLMALEAAFTVWGVPDTRPRLLQLIDPNLAATQPLLEALIGLTTAFDLPRLIPLISMSLAGTPLEAFAALAVARHLRFPSPYESPCLYDTPMDILMDALRAVTGAQLPAQYVRQLTFDEEP